MSERKLATVRRIDKLEPIEGADKIVKATVGGWQLVTAIDNKFKEGDLVVYCEIDSWIPHEIAPFLSKGQYPRVYNGVDGERLKTIKLRGQVSQGLLLPMSIVEVECGNPLRVWHEGEDVTDLLGIQKWEAPISPQLAGIRRGPFPSFGRKTDQERIQNLSREFEQYKADGLTFEVTEKLEGSSMSVYYKDGEFGVCSRNMNLKETDGNTFWQVARKLDLEEKMRNIGLNIMLQGELIGPGIQGNIYGLKEHEFHLFDVFDIDKYEYAGTAKRYDTAVMFGIPHVPILLEASTLTDTPAILKYAEAKSMLANVEREGIVFKCIEKPDISFKAISNKYLLNQKD